MKFGMANFSDFYGLPKRGEYCEIQRNLISLFEYSYWLKTDGKPICINYLQHKNA